MLLPCFVVIKDWSVSAPNSDLKGGMKYRDGKLTVPIFGRYYIYAQLYFRNRGLVFIEVNNKSISTLQPTGRPGPGTVYAGRVFNLNATDVITITTSSATTVFMAPNRAYFGAFLI